MLEIMKMDVVKYAQLAERQGLCQHRSGNFSARDLKTGYICITPTGMDRAELTYKDIVVINMDAEIVEASTGLRPTSDALMHIAAYKARPDVLAVAHTHSRYATVLGVLGKSIPAVVYDISLLGCRKGYVPSVADARPGSEKLAANISDPLKISDALLLQKHGAVAVGGNIKEALLKAEYIESLADVYYHALVLNHGEEPPVIPLQDLEWTYPAAIK